MNAVGIDVSKGKSMMMALQPMNQVVLKPREYSHTKAGLGQMAHDILRLGEETRVIMEATGRYHEPVAAALHEYGIRVTVMNPLFIKQSGGGSIRKVKTDKADARKIAKYGLDNWMDLREYTPVEAIREQLKLVSRQFNLYMKNVVALQNNLISLTDKVFPRGERTVSQPNRTGVKSGLIFSRPSGIVSVFAWSARKPSQDVTRNGASGRDIISAHPKRRSRIWAVQAISRSCSETAIPSCSLPPPPRTGFCEGCAGRHAL